MIVLFNRIGEQGPHKYSWRSGRLDYSGSIQSYILTGSNIGSGAGVTFMDDSKYYKNAVGIVGVGSGPWKHFAKYMITRYITPRQIYNALVQHPSNSGLVGGIILAAIDYTSPPQEGVYYTPAAQGFSLYHTGTSGADIAEHHALDAWRDSLSSITQVVQGTAVSVEISVQPMSYSIANLDGGQFSIGGTYYSSLQNTPLKSFRVQVPFMRHRDWQKLMYLYEHNANRNVIVGIEEGEFLERHVLWGQISIEDTQTIGVDPAGGYYWTCEIEYTESK